MHKTLLIYILIQAFVLVSCSEKQTSNANAGLITSEENRHEKLTVLADGLISTNVEELFIACKKLKQLSNGKLDYRLVVKVLAKMPNMTLNEQEHALLIMRNNMSFIYLPRIKPFLFSDNETIARTAFLLLDELGSTEVTKSLYVSLSYLSISSLVRHESRLKLN